MIGSKFTLFNSLVFGVFLCGYAIGVNPPAKTPPPPPPLKPGMVFQERLDNSLDLLDLMSKLDNNVALENANKASIDQLKAQIKNIGTKAGFSVDSVEILKDKDSFFNTVTKEDAKKLGNLSALVYDIDQKKQLKNISKAHTALDRRISSSLGEIKTLEARLEDLVVVSRDTEKFNKFKESLSIFGLTLKQGADFSAVQSAIGRRIEDIEKEIEQLELEKSLEQTQYLSGAKKAFATNLAGMNMEVEGVFHRNNGEFSGVAAYNKVDHKLVLSFAGSKSAMDWVKNFLGWNRKLSTSHGLLSNISFHSGFGSYLDDNAPSFFSFMKGWLNKFKKENPNTTLNLLGTGHSLGGALAEIFSAATKEMAEALGIKVNIGVMTFGAPNTVAPTTLDNFTKILGGPGKIIRFSHEFDPVPKVVFWKTTGAAATIKGDKSLFYDVNGTLQLPIRANPHSSFDYAHAAETVFANWQKDYFIPLKALIDNLIKEELKGQELSKQSREISLKMLKIRDRLAKIDMQKADVLEDEYQVYIKGVQALVPKYEGELRSLINEIQAATSANKKLSSAEQAEFLKKESQIKTKIGAVESLLKLLEKDTPWKQYAKKTSDDFQALLERYALLNPDS